MLMADSCKCGIGSCGLGVPVVDGRGGVDFGDQVLIWSGPSSLVWCNVMVAVVVDRLGTGVWQASGPRLWGRPRGRSADIIRRRGSAVPSWSSRWQDPVASPERQVGGRPSLGSSHGQPRSCRRESMSTGLGRLDIYFRELSAGKLWRTVMIRLPCVIYVFSAVGILECDEAFRQSVRASAASYRWLGRREESAVILSSLGTADGRAAKRRRWRIHPSMTAVSLTDSALTDRLRSRLAAIGRRTTTS